MHLQDLITTLKPERIEGSLGMEVSGITYDSRRVVPGTVFVAMTGQNVDGHDFISSAIDRGASAIICERNGFSSQRASKVKVANSREALARLSAAFYQHPSRRLKVIGVTGTNGKTTVTFLIKKILEVAGTQCGLLGTVQYEIGERVIPAQRTTPESSDLQQMLAQMLQAGCRACVMEVSSHALEQHRVLEIDFDLAVFTNLTQDHLDFHGSMEAYYTSKKKLFTGLEASAKPQGSIINVDDGYGRRLVKELPALGSTTYGTSPEAAIRAGNISLAAGGTDFSVETKQGVFQFSMPLIGRHNVSNALAAISAGLSLGIEISLIKKALAEIPGVPGRLERVGGGQPFSVFVDYAHTEDALRHVLRTLREVTSGRLLLAFGCGGSRDRGKRSKMGAAAAELADWTLITTDNPRRESPEAIAAEVEQGFRSVKTEGYEVMLDRREAIRSLLQKAQANDVVLIAGKGHETYQEFSDTIVPFDDRLYARQTLEELGDARAVTDRSAKPGNRGTNHSKNKGD